MSTWGENVTAPATRWNNDVLHCSAECLLLAQSGHFATEFQCPLWGVKRTLIGGAARSVCDRGLMAPGGGGGGRGGRGGGGLGLGG